MSSEIFSKLLYHAIQNKVYRSRGVPDIFHLFYAEDCLLIVGATLNDATCLATLIDAYCYHYGQFVSYDKSYLTFNPSTPFRVKDAILNLLHIKEKNSVWQYLGLQIAPK